MATAQVSRDTPSLTSALAAATKAQLQELLSHSWTTQAFTEKLGVKGAIRTWAQQNGLLSQYRITALRQLLQHRPPAPLRDLLLDLINDSGQEPELLAAILRKLGAELATRAELACDGWGNFLVARAQGSLLEGCTAILTGQLAYQGMFAAIDAACPRQSVWRTQIDQWSSPQAVQFAHQLSDAIDGLLLPGHLEQNLPGLQSVAGMALRWQKAYLDLCWFGQGLPV